MKRYFMFIVLFVFCGFMVVACSDNDENTSNNEKDIANEEENDLTNVANETDNDNENMNQENEVDNDNDNTNQEIDLDDNGDEVIFSGEATYEDHLLTVEGDTNLPEGASVFINPNTLDNSSFINVSRSANIESDGSFQFETNIPEKYDYGLNVIVRFRPEEQTDEAVQEIYGKTGEHLEGPFVRLYEESLENEIMKQASTSIYLPLEEDDSAQEEISEPAWEEPDDYGDEVIRIEADVEVEEDFILVQGESNLIEGSELSLSPLNEDGIRAGSGDRVHTTPDGSFRGWIENPNEDEELEYYHVRISFQPTEYDWENIVEQYGEEGNKMSGELVEDGEATLEVPIDN